MYACNRVRRLISIAIAVAALVVCPAARSEEPAKAAAAKPATPPAPSTDLLDTLGRSEKYPTFLKVVAASGMEQRLREVGPYTLLVPNEEAFAKLPKETLDLLLADKARIVAIMRQHIVEGKLSAEDLAKQKTVKTLGESELVVTPPAAGEPVKLDSALVIGEALQATNGLAYTINIVLTPK